MLLKSGFVQDGGARPSCGKAAESSRRHVLGLGSVLLLTPCWSSGPAEGIERVRRRAWITVYRPNSVVHVAANHSTQHSPCLSTEDAVAPFVLQSSRRGMDRYIKKKGLDPLDTYVPPVLQARQQLAKAGEIMGMDNVICACSYAACML